MDLSQYNFLESYKDKRRLLLDVSIVVIWGVFLLWVGELLRARLQSYQFIVNSPEPARVAAFFLFLAVLFVLTKTFLIWFISSQKSTGVYMFKNHDWPSEWIFNGKTEPLTKIDNLHVKSSRAGCLLRKYKWKNLRMTFDMKFAKSRVRPKMNVGLIFRADDLDNYFMLEILQDNPFDGQKITGLKPHVRFHGGWELMDIEEKHLDFSEFTKIILEVKEDTVTFFYKDKPIFNWILPTHVDVNHVEAGSKQKDDSGQKDVLGQEIVKSVHEVPFRLACGMIGFRAHPGQGAIIKGLKIEPL